MFAAIGLGEAFGTRWFGCGLTDVAAATSLPDTLISVAGARIDEPAVSLGNVPPIQSVMGEARAETP